MAELLIKAIDATHPDPEIDKAGCYKAGDVVVVMEDGHEWGRKEGLPNFVVLKIPGADPERIRDLVNPQKEDDTGAVQLDEDQRPRIFRRRKWRLLVSNLPLTVRQQLMTTGEFTATPAQVRNFIRRVRDNLQFAGL